jgi:uncharacterized protein
MSRTTSISAGQRSSGSLARMLRIIRSADYPTRPWKNGGGTTRDIFVEPPQASLDDFDWRMSLAQVDRDGPFSRFDNVDRTLVLLSGAMTLHEQERRIGLVRGEPVSFPGERDVTATLSGGSTLDLNVMTRRGRMQHWVRSSLIGKRYSMKLGARGVLHILFALEGGLIIDGEPLDAHDTAIVSAQHSLVEVPAGRAAVLCIDIVDFRPNVR